MSKCGQRPSSKICRGRRVACDLTVADCGLLLATAPHAARTEVIGLTIFDESLSEFQPERNGLTRIRISNALLSLPAVAGECFRSLDAIPFPHSLCPKQLPWKLLAQFSLSRERDVANIIA